MDLIVRNARLSHAPEAPPVDIGVAAGRIVAIEPALQSDGPVFDAGGCLVCAGLVETHIHLDKSSIIDRCAPEQRSPGEFDAACRRGEADVHGRGRVRTRQPHAGEVHQARCHANAHASGAGWRRGDAQLRGDRGAAARLRLGDRRRGVRVPAGGTDRQSASRRAAGRGTEAWRERDRRGAELRSGPCRTDPSYVRPGARIRCGHRHASRFRQFAG